MKMTIYVKCPKCDDEFEFKAVLDAQGEGVWMQSFTFAELVKQNCNCEINDDEMSAIEAEANEKANEWPEPEVD